MLNPTEMLILPLNKIKRCNKRNYRGKNCHSNDPSRLPVVRLGPSQKIHETVIGFVEAFVGANNKCTLKRIKKLIT